MPRQRNGRPGSGREENAEIKAGETPEGWDDRPAKRRQKDTDARWTKKHGKSHDGYKNHVDVDRRRKLIVSVRSAPPYRFAPWSAEMV